MDTLRSSIGIVLDGPGHGTLLRPFPRTPIILSIPMILTNSMFFAKDISLCRLLKIDFPLLFLRKELNVK